MLSYQNRKFLWGDKTMACLFVLSSQWGFHAGEMVSLNWNGALCLKRKLGLQNSQWPHDMETLSLLQALYAYKPLAIFEIVVDSLKKFFFNQRFNMLVQERHNSIANALVLRLSCTNPLSWFAGNLRCHGTHVIISKSLLPFVCLCPYIYTYLCSSVCFSPSDTQTLWIVPVYPMTLPHIMFMKKHTLCKAPYDEALWHLKLSPPDDMKLE